MEFNYYLVNLIRLSQPNQLIIFGKKYLVWLSILTKSTEIGAKPLFYFLVCWHRHILLVQKKKKQYLSTNLAIRLSLSISLATSRILIHTKDVYKDWNLKLRKKRTWFAAAF